MGSIHSRELLNFAFEFKLQTANESSAIVMVEVFYIHKDTSIKTHKLIFHYEKLATKKKIKMKNAYKCTPLNITFISNHFSSVDHISNSILNYVCQNQYVLFIYVYIYIYFLYHLYFPLFSKPNVTSSKSSKFMIQCYV